MLVLEDYIAFTMEDDNEDIGAIKETSVGRIEPGQSVTKSIYLHGGNVTGSRLINITVSIKRPKRILYADNGTRIGKIFYCW